jgi:hypothetical protein
MGKAWRVAPEIFISGPPPPPYRATGVCPASKQKHVLHSEFILARIDGGRSQLKFDFRPQPRPRKARHLSEWLAANECTHVAMEATGVYWKPVWHILNDGDFELVCIPPVKAACGGGLSDEIMRARKFAN